MASEDALPDPIGDDSEEVMPPQAPVSVWKSVAAHMHSRKLRITELFSVIDKDKSKTVDKKELFEFLKTLGVEANKDELKDAFTLKGKCEKELNLSQLKAEVTKFSREVASESNDSRAKSPVRSRTPSKATSGYGQSTSSSSSRTKATKTGSSNSSPTEKRPSKTVPAKTSTSSSKTASSSRATGATQASTAKTVSKPTTTTTTTTTTTKKAAPIQTKTPSTTSSKEKTPASPDVSDLDQLNALAEASTSENDRARREAAEAQAGISLIGLEDDDWENGGGSKNEAKKKKGMILCFDEKGLNAASLLYEELVDLKVEVTALFKAETKKTKLSDHIESIDTTALLVILKTDSYGKEPKNVAEVEKVKGGTTSTLVLDLCEEGVKSHLSNILPQDVLEQHCFHRFPGGWDPTIDTVPEGVAAHCVNFMISEQSKHASYNEDISAKYAATSNAKPRRLSKIDFDSLGAEEEEEEEPEEVAANDDDNGDGEEEMDDEAAFARFQQEQNA